MIDFESFDAYLNAEAIKAIERFEAAVASVQQIKLPTWFERILESEIKPTLKGIGIDEPIQRALFKMAAPAWESMGPIPINGLWFHPEVDRCIEEVRTGILLNEGQNSETFFLISQSNPYEIFDMVNRSMDPENLFSTLDKISTPWIALPRAYRHLERSDAPYFLGYLRYLSNEASLEFRKILIRIIIEFLGNYTHKFSHAGFSRDEIQEALFFGYSAMFWRNLRQPVAGFEAFCLYNFFLIWAHRLANQYRSPSPAILDGLNKMTKAANRVLPEFRKLGSTRGVCDEKCQFLISLRHGDPGIQYAMNCYGVGTSLYQNSTNGHLPYSDVPGMLAVFFRKIKDQYRKETLRTQEFIRVFLSDLKTVYDRSNFPQGQGGKIIDNPLRFVGARITGMIDDVVASIC